MYHVYILRDNVGKLYIGYSANLRQRIKQHTEKKVFTSSRMDEPKMIYYEAYNEEHLARQREIKLKQFGSAYNGLLKRLKIK